MRDRSASALKEWSSVVAALRSGRQALLIRKGGLADRGKAFALEDTEFFLYPTYLHQQVEFVKPEFVPDFRQALVPPAPEGLLALDTYAVAQEALPVATREALLRLAPLHTWNERFIDHRLQWKPEDPAWVVPVRVYRLPAPVLLPEERRYRGCRSWVKLAREVSTLGATPVLSDGEFAAYVTAVRERLTHPLVAAPPGARPGAG